MIELKDQDLFAQGGRRFCFKHPQDAGKCIKTLSPAGDPATRRKQAPWYKRRRSLLCFDDNFRELASFHQLNRYGADIWDHFPRCYGMHSTNRGQGICTDLVRNADGSIPLSVREYVVENGKTAELLAALKVFFDFLVTHGVVTRDVLDHNILAVEGPDGLRVVMIDGFGSSEWIPVSLLIPAVGRCKARRKERRFASRYGF